MGQEAAAYSYREWRSCVWRRQKNFSTVVAMHGWYPYGFAVQPIGGSMAYGVSEKLAELFRESVNGTLGSEVARRAVLPAPNDEQPQ
jgi:hypothetical protein